MIYLTIWFITKAGHKNAYQDAMDFRLGVRNFDMRIGLKNISM